MKQKKQTKQKDKTSNPQQRGQRDACVECEPILRFTPTAWAKLLYFRDCQDTEVGGFGVTSADDLLLVEEFVTVKQDVSAASVCFDDAAVADFFDAQAERVGLR